MIAPFVVLACGNPSRGDDALGPLLLSRLAAWLESVGLSERFELIEDFQFQVEHALDLQRREGVLFIDASETADAPFELSLLLPDASPSHSTHAISPGAVLSVYQKVVGGVLPPAWLLSVRGERYALGEGLSRAGTAHLEAAWAALQGFCQAGFVWPDS